MPTPTSIQHLIDNYVDTPENRSTLITYATEHNPEPIVNGVTKRNPTAVEDFFAPYRPGMNFSLPHAIMYVAAYLTAHEAYYDKVLHEILATNKASKHQAWFAMKGFVSGGDVSINQIPYTDWENATHNYNDNYIRLA